MSIKLGKKLTGLALCLALSAAGVYANTLSEVRINSEDSGYAVVLKTDEEAQMKKVISSPDKMYIELKDVQASDELNTIYNNAENIDNITIQPVSKNDLKITLQGKNVSSSKILFEDAQTAPAPVQSEEESIELGAPMAAYTPVYDAGIEEIDQTANPQLNSALTAMNIDREKVVTTKNFLKKAANKAGDSNILIALGILVICAIFMFKPQKEAKQGIKIGLSQSLKDSGTQRELSIARKTSAPTTSLKYSGAAKANYGVNAYKQSLKNPYMTTNTAPSHNGISGIPRKPVVHQKTPALSAAPAKNLQPRTNTLTPPVKNPIMAEKPEPINNQRAVTNVDSVKFLESITKIYEKNGRQDLAKGLKDNLKKVQTISHGI